MDNWKAFMTNNPVIEAFEELDSTMEIHEAQREMPPAVDIRYTDAPDEWRNPEKFEDVPPYSGTGLLHQPYTDFYTKIWGLQPIRDLWYYRQLARTDPWVQKSLQLQVDLALQKGYEWQVHPDAPRHDDMMQTIKDIFELVQCEFEKDILPSIAWNMLTFGSGWLEMVYSKGRPDEIPNVRKVKENGKDVDMFHPEPGILVNIKSLDPYTMRVRQDAYGNIYGYAQILKAQPILFSTDKIVQYKWQPRTVPYENAYGTSELMALLRDCEYIRAIEGDLYMAGHAIVKPPMIFKDRAETPPLSDTEWARIKSANQDRKIGDDVYAMGLDVEPQVEVGRALSAMIEFYRLKRDDRSVGLGVPRNVMGIPEGSSRTTIEINMNSFYTKIKGFQSDIGATTVWKVVWPAAERLGWTRSEFIENLPQMDFVDVAIQDENLNADREIKIFEKGLMDVNTARKELNMEELEDEARGDMYYDEIFQGGGEGGFGEEDVKVREPALTQPKASINTGIGPNFPELVEKVQKKKKKSELEYGASENLFKEMESKWEKEEMVLYGQ